MSGDVSYWVKESPWNLSANVTQRPDGYHWSLDVMRTCSLGVPQWEHLGDGIAKTLDEALTELGNAERKALAS